MPGSVHQSVLEKEVLEGLAPQEGEIYLDGTLGGAGHAVEIGKLLGKKGTIIGLDEDRKALERAKKKLSSFKGTLHLEKENFRNLDQVLDQIGIREVDLLLLDLGMSSDQLESSGRGFSFQKDEPLLMTLSDETEGRMLTAEAIVNKFEEENLATIIHSYGEEQFARKIAKAIVAAREEKLIETTFELLEVIKGAVPTWYRHRKTHFATKTFQALRMTVNDELGALIEGLEKGWKRLSIGGRIAVISFHSLEDRIVKVFFKNKKEEGLEPLTKKPLQASKDEIIQNPRSRSAKLRIATKTIFQ